MKGEGALGRRWGRSMGRQDGDGWKDLRQQRGSEHLRPGSGEVPKQKQPVGSFLSSRNET